MMRLLLPTMASAKFTVRPDGTRLTRFEYSSRMWITFAAVTGQNFSNFSLLDVGASDGEAGRVAAKVIGLHGAIVAYDIVKRPEPEVRQFDGKIIPEADNSFEVVVFSSVLHHAAQNAYSLLREAARVSREWVLITEQAAFLDDDWNKGESFKHDRNGIFRSVREWSAMFNDVGLEIIAHGPQFDFNHPDVYYVLRKANLPRRCRPGCFRNPPLTQRIVLNGTINMPAGAMIWDVPSVAPKRPAFPPGMTSGKTIFRYGLHSDTANSSGRDATTDAAVDVEWSLTRMREMWESESKLQPYQWHNRG